MHRTYTAPTMTLKVTSTTNHPSHILGGSVPIELGKTTVRKKLTEEDKAFLTQQGASFRCRQVGHIASQYTQKKEKEPAARLAALRGTQ